MKYLDITLQDINRRELDVPDYKVKEVLPEFFRATYPKLISLLDSYYEFEDTGTNSPARFLNDLFKSRDITQTDIELLSYIEDELLLGQAYFEGFKDKRAAAKYSNTLYRSKGTKYSIQQFFRTFFGIDPDIIYTKENVFKVGLSDSLIGSESQRYLTNDKLYQTFALLIKAEIPFAKWKETYKLFTHPAGMFVGSEIQIVSSVTDLMEADSSKPAPTPPIVIENTADLGFVHMEGIDVINQGGLPSADVTSILDDPYTDATGVMSRINTYLNLEKFGDDSIRTIDRQYSSLRELQIATSPTFDDSDLATDSAGGTLKGMDMSNNFHFETLDQEEHQWWSGDSDLYYSLLDSASWL
jgi:hypothetical protein